MTLERTREGWIIEDGEAWLPEDWDRRERRRAQWRSYKASHSEQNRLRASAWNLAHPEQHKANTRAAWRRKREAELGTPLRAVRIVASLHHLACIGRTRREGCVCPKGGKVYVVEAA